MWIGEPLAVRESPTRDVFVYELCSSSVVARWLQASPLLEVDVVGSLCPLDFPVLSSVAWYSIGLHDVLRVFARFAVLKSETASTQACLPLFGSLRCQTPPCTNSLHNEVCLSMYGSLRHDTLSSTSSPCGEESLSLFGSPRDVAVYELC